MHYDLIVDIALTPIDNPSAKNVLVAIARYSNGSGECFPSRETLSKDTLIPIRTVSRCIQWLKDHGYIQIISRSGSSNFYILTCMKEEDMSDEHTRAKLAHEVDSNIYPIVNSNNSNLTLAKLAHPLNNPLFAAFWQAYPRKIGKGAARTAFDRARKLADANDIIKAAMVYSRHCQEMQTEPKYIPHATTWLNQERWEDDLSAELPDKKSGWGDALNEL